MEELAIFKPFARGEKHKIIKTANAVIYTRVSTKDQVDNLSLDTQRKFCMQYAERHNLTILREFGGTNESAKTDERTQFKAMIQFVKASKQPVSFIVVASLERFSRSDDAIWLSNSLARLGAQLVSATQPMDTSSPTGQMQRNLLLLFGNWENMLRRDKVIAGMREMIARGNWPGKPPLGYEIKKSGAERTIVISETGTIIRQAFHWKANEQLTDEAIRERLARNGIALCHQTIGKIFRNPFYAGVICHGLLDGKIVQGNHEAIVSKELFLRVNGIISQNTHGYSVKEENEQIPLKRFLKCDKCGQSLRGYIVKKKGLWYYKCSTVGCNTNRRANALHARFKEILEWFRLGGCNDFLKLVKQQAVATFHAFNKDHEDKCMLLRSQHAELEKKITRLEERFIAEELPSDLYYKYMAKFKEEREALEVELETATAHMSNLDECVNTAINLAVDIPRMWDSADYTLKQRIQNMLFPEGIRYDRQTDQCRTLRINSVFLYLAYLQQVVSNKKIGIPALQLGYADFAPLVARRGIERNQLPTDCQYFIEWIISDAPNYSLLFDAD